MSKRRASPDSNLGPRRCEGCGSTFRPYRDSQRACQRRCYDRLPDRKAAVAAVGRREDVRERKNQARRVESNPGRRLVNLRRNLQRYGVTLDQYEALVTKQDGRCAICGERPDPDGRGAAARLHVDHHHLTGRNRSLLCGRCNPGIGYFREDPALLRAAADYIERYRT